MPFNSDYRATLTSHDAHWAWKLALRVLLLLVDVTAIGLIAWAFASALSENDDDLDVWDADIVPWSFIPLGASLIWCTIVILIHTLRKIPVHPGVVVGLDLVMWLAFAIFSSFTVIAGSQIIDTNDRSFSDGFESDSGYYTTAANGSSIFVEPSNSSDCPRFSSCGDQSSLGDKIRHRGVVEMAAGALMIFALALHFTLFVWGCVDTAARNSTRTHDEAKAIANAMIAEMVANGQIPPPQRPLLIPSQRGSQAMSETITRENSAYYMTPAGGYYAPQNLMQGQARPQSQPKQQMQFAPPPHLAAMPQAPQETHPAFRMQGAPPQAALPPQQVKSEGDTPHNSDGNGSGYQTPHSRPSQTSADYHAVSTDRPDDPDAIRPLPPTRAPGHIYSPRSSVADSISPV